MIAQQPLRPRPLRHLGILAEHDREHVGDRALLDHEGAVHIGFAEFEFGIEQQAQFGARVSKRTDTGLPVPSPKVKVRAARGRDAECAPPDKRLRTKLEATGPSAASTHQIDAPPPAINSDTPRRGRSKRSDLGI